MTRIFIGPNGLRPGWGIALYLIVAFVAAIAIALLSRLVLGAVLQNPALAIDLPLGETTAFTAALIATLIMGRVERRSPWSYGLADRALVTRVASGVGWGGALLSLELAVLYATHQERVVASHLSPTTLLTYAAIWGYAFLVTALFEETFFRGYLLATLARGMGFWPAAVVLSLVFGALHLANPGEALIGGLGAGLIGFLLCFALRRSGSLWWPIGFHAGWDWTQSYVWGSSDSGTVVPNTLLLSHASGPAVLSGGSVGPEGSIFLFGALALAVVVIARTFRPPVTV